MKISGGFKMYSDSGELVGRHFGGKAKQEFIVQLRDGRKEFVAIGWMSSWLRPKVEAWWQANVVSSEAFE